MGDEKREVRRPKTLETDDVFGLPSFDEQVQSPIVRNMRVMANIINAPVVWIRKNIVERYRGPTYYYYHQKFKRAPTIDQCYTDDMACIYEANIQFKRDKMVDDAIINILNNRVINCFQYNRVVNEFTDRDKICQKEKKDYQDARLANFIKYGDVGTHSSVVDFFMKQQHRLIWERRQALKNENQEN